MWPAPANSYLLREPGGAALIDAGCGTAGCYDKLKSFLLKSGVAPADVHTLVLSHAHPDHMGAVPFLLEESSPRIYIHSLEEALARENGMLNETFDMGLILEHYSDRLAGIEPVGILEYFEAVECPMGAAAATDLVGEGNVLEICGRSFEVIHTPGHAPGHISLYDRGDGTLLSGDIVGAVVAWYCPSGGGARGYLESLDKLEALGGRRILPSHGDEIADVDGAIRETREFILGRERALEELLARGPASLLALTDALFPNEGTRMFPGLQVTLSHLQKLEEDGRVECSGEGAATMYRLAGRG